MISTITCISPSWLITRARARARGDRGQELDRLLNLLVVHNTVCTRGKTRGVGVVEIIT